MLHRAFVGQKRKRRRSEKYCSGCDKAMSKSTYYRHLKSEQSACSGTERVDIDEKYRSDEQDGIDNESDDFSGRGTDRTIAHEERESGEFESEVDEGEFSELFYISSSL